MNKTLLWGLIFILSASVASSAATRKIKNPDYEARTSGILKITGIELSDTATRVSFHGSNAPGWWIGVNRNADLRDNASGKLYSPIRSEGITLGEHFTFPESGEADFTLVYPPLPKNVRSVDFDPEDWKIYGIRLDGRKAPKNHVDIAKWEKEHSKSYPGCPEEFFTKGICKLSGRIIGYDTRVMKNNFVIYASNPITNAYNPKAVTIADDGSFAIELPLECPGDVSIDIENAFITVYAEPGRALDILMDREDLLNYNIELRRGHRVSCRPAAFGNELGLINSEYANAPQPKHSYIGDLHKTATPTEAVNTINEWADDYGEALDNYISGNALNPVTVKLLETARKLYAPGCVLDYDMFWYNLSMDPNEKDLPSLKEPMTIRHYDTVRSLLLESDPWIFAHHNISILLNRLAYSHIGTIAGIDGALDVTIIGGPVSFLIDNGAQFTPAERKWARHIRNNCGKTIAMNWQQLMEFANNFNAEKIAERNGLSEGLQKFNEENPGGTVYLVVQNQAKSWARTAEYLRLLTGTIGTPYLWQAASVGRFCGSGRFRPEDTPRETVDEEIRQLTENGVLQDSIFISTIRGHFDDLYANISPELPDDERGALVRRLLAPHKGKYVLFDFWATSCGPCRANIQNSAKTREANRNHPQFKTIFITGEEESPEGAYNAYIAKNLQDEESHRLPQAEFNLLRDLFHFNGIPRYVLFDGEGKVVHRDLPFEQLSTILEKYDIRLNEPEGEVSGH